MTAKLPTSPIASHAPQPPVSIQISYNQPAYIFRADGNVVVDSITYKIVVADGAFLSKGHENFSKNLEMKTPL
jgi:hypothetical protein